jgi:hypothetical protein
MQILLYKKSYPQARQNLIIRRKKETNIYSQGRAGYPQGNIDNKRRIFKRHTGYLQPPTESL